MWDRREKIDGIEERVFFSLSSTICDKSHTHHFGGCRGAEACGRRLERRTDEKCVRRLCGGFRLAGLHPTQKCGWRRGRPRLKDGGVPKYYILVGTVYTAIQIINLSTQIITQILVFTVFMYSVFYVLSPEIQKSARMSLKGGPCPCPRFPTVEGQ